MVNTLTFDGVFDFDNGMTLLPRTVLCGCLCFAITNPFVLAQPKIEVVGPHVVDFGEYPAWERRTATYTIKNTGTSDLRILGIRKTCGCSSAKTHKSQITPGGETQVEVIIEGNSIFGLYNKNTFVESNDPEMRFLKLNLSGDAIPLLDVEPSHEVNLGRIPLKAIHKQMFKLTASEPVAFGNPDVMSSHPVDVTLFPGPESHAKAFQLEASVLPSTKSGDLSCKISIPILSPTNHAPLSLELSARLGAQLNCVPGILYVPLSEEPIKKTFTCWVLGQRSRILDSTDLKLLETEGIAYSAKPVRKGHALEVTVALSPEFTSRLYVENKLSLTFSVPNAASGSVVCRIKK